MKMFQFSPPFSQLLWLSVTSYHMDCSCGQFQSTVPAVSAPCLLPTFSLVAVEGWVGKRENFNGVQVLLSNSQNIGVRSTLLVTSAKHSTIGTTTSKVSSFPDRPSTITYFGSLIEFLYCLTMKKKIALQIPDGMVYMACLIPKNIKVNPHLE